MSTFNNSPPTLTFTIINSTTVSVGPYNSTISGSIIIPPTATHNGTTYNVTSIVNNAFQSCAGITSLTIPNSVTTIGRSAFQNCTSLPSVTFGLGLKTINTNAFLSCTGIKKVTFEGLIPAY